MQQKIKVAIFIPTLQAGGQERYTSILCNHINTELFDVTLHVVNNEAPFFTITNANIKVVNLGVKRVRNTFLKLYAVVKKEKPAIVFTTGHHLNLFFAISKFLLPRKVKLIARESTIVSMDNKMQKMQRLLNMLAKLFYRNIDFVVCQSEAMQSDLILNYNVNPKKTIVINNFVEDIAGDEIFRPHRDTKEPIFISVARLSKEKGLYRIIEGLSSLSIPYKYYIFGEGAERAALELLIKKLNLGHKVLLCGETANPFEKVRTVNLFLMGSYYEGFPNVLLEAGIRGIPVVAFPSVGGSNEVLIAAVNGFIAEKEHEFPGLVAKAIDFPFDRLAIRKRIEDKYSVQIIMSKIERLFTSLAQLK